MRPGESGVWGSSAEIWVMARRAYLAVCDDAVVEDLQEDVEHVAVRLLDLVEEDDAVRPPPDRLRQLPALVVAHVPCMVKRQA